MRKLKIRLGSFFFSFHDKSKQKLGFDSVQSRCTAESLRNEEKQNSGTKLISDNPRVFLLKFMNPNYKDLKCHTEVEAHA